MSGIQVGLWRSDLVWRGRGAYSLAMQTRILPLIASVVLVATSFAAEPAKFASGIVDIGMVAKDFWRVLWSRS